MLFVPKKTQGTSNSASVSTMATEQSSSSASPTSSDQVIGSSTMASVSSNENDEDEDAASRSSKHVHFFTNSISRFRESIAGSADQSSVASTRTSTTTTTTKDQQQPTDSVKTKKRRLHDLYSALRSVEWSKYALPAWRVIFAIVAMADMVTCFPILMQGWTLRDREQQQQQQQSHGLFHHLHANNNNKTFLGSNTSTCASTDYEYYYQYYGSVLKQGIGIAFCLFCLVEAVLRSREAQSSAIEDSALDKFEKQLTRAYSTTRMSFVGSFRMPMSIRLDPNNNITPSHMDEMLARNTIRIWIPVFSVMTFWLLLLPLANPREYTCDQDQALATTWIAYLTTQFTIFAEWFQEKVFSVVWKLVMPYNFLQPQRLFNRVRQILRLIRYVRFAGPIARMTLKLGDQIVNLVSTWRQRLAARLEKAKRKSRPSMLFSDIKRIESLAKLQTALARLPSQVIRLAQDKMAAPSMFGQNSSSLEEKREQGRKWKGQIDDLKLDLRHRRSFNESVSDLYDRVVQLTEELQSNLNNTVLSSPQHLISPHSRFGLMWRLTVTNCFLMEITRLTMSWQLSGTFKISLRSIMSKMLVECNPSDVKNKFSLKVLHNAAHGFHKHLAHVIPLLPPPEEHFAVCMPTSTTSILFLKVGRAMETFIDMVGFLDIFIWFFTGELDANGLVVPKQFFYRCILPGTLSQILDHPTLPDILPGLISRFINATNAVGVSRVLRWVLAIVPATIMLVVNPLESFFIGTVDSDKDGMMHYAESFGVLAPRNPSISANVDNSLLNSRARSSGNQVGLSLSTRFDLSERENDDGAVDQNARMPDLPSPRPLWSQSRKIVDVDPNLFDNDDSYSFDYSALQY